jgi:hypothetical protein
MQDTQNKPVAVVNFRTMQNGAFKYMRRGMTRGYWRVLLVNDPKGCLKVGSKNVLEVLYSGPEGISGVTERSSYYIKGSHDKAILVCNEYNASV